MNKATLIGYCSKPQICTKTRGKTTATCQSSTINALAKKSGLHNTNFRKAPKLLDAATKRIRGGLQQRVHKQYCICFTWQRKWLLSYTKWHRKRWKPTIVSAAAPIFFTKKGNVVVQEFRKGLHHF